MVATYINANPSTGNPITSGLSQFAGNSGSSNSSGATSTSHFPPNSGYDFNGPGHSAMSSSSSNNGYPSNGKSFHSNNASGNNGGRSFNSNNFRLTGSGGYKPRFNGSRSGNSLQPLFDNTSNRFKLIPECQICS